MREAEDTGRVDFFTTVQRLRVDRMNMVQTAEQYGFLHRAAQIAIVCMGITFPAKDVHKRLQDLEQLSETGQSCMETEFKAICNICDDDYEHPNIGAAFIQSFTKQDHWILTQLPLATKVTDFWRMVIRCKVSLIVAFDVEPENREMNFPRTFQTVGEYLPEEVTNTTKCSPFNIEAGPVLGGHQLESKEVLITDESMAPHMRFEDEHRARHLKVKMTDLDPLKILALASEIRSYRPTGEERTIFMCRNGADHSGLMSVALLLLDRMDNDHRLTVPLVVGAIKAIRPQIIPTLEQYSLLYQILRLHSENTNLYSNV